MSNNEFHSGFVAILGRPNVGKSTIMNHLIGMKIAAVSKRAQTTRKRIQTVYTEERGQIVFLDTPGVNRAETKLGEFMLESATDTLKTADIIMWVIEPSEFVGAGERVVAELIGKAVKSSKKTVKSSKKTGDEESDGNGETNESAVSGAVKEAAVSGAVQETVVSGAVKEAAVSGVVQEASVSGIVQKVPVILLVNKADTAEEKTINETFERYNEYMTNTEGISFDTMMAVSATKGDGLEELKTTLFEKLPVGPMYYDEDTVTDETEREIATFIREKCLRNLDKEIPHGIAVVVDKMHTRGKSGGGSIVDIEATIICERESHKGIIIGKKGVMLRKIGTEARHDIEDMLQEKVNLKLWVKVRPGWRDKKNYMSEYGYKKQ